MDRDKNTNSISNEKEDVSPDYYLMSKTITNNSKWNLMSKN